ncbi:nucleotide excision repair, TFIIH, subunit [Atractiella rhizophila]|nr:nucleotide excision repair, TFIIH, subunit [Atractiella rhizophila]
MVRAVKGVLLSSDSAVKQLLLQMDDERAAQGYSRFVIHDLDDNHVLISADMVDFIKDQLMLELEKNTFHVETAILKSSLTAVM